MPHELRVVASDDYQPIADQVADGLFQLSGDEVVHGGDEIVGYLVQQRTGAVRRRRGGVDGNQQFARLYHPPFVGVVVGDAEHD